MRRARATIQAEAVMIQKKKAEAVMPEAVTLVDSKKKKARGSDHL
jgi:hypothetical protein